MAELSQKNEMSVLLLRLMNIVVLLDQTVTWNEMTPFWLGNISLLKVQKFQNEILGVFIF